jgi:hypothetical protein
MSNEFCPAGHELNADGTCSRDGYVKPAEVATEPETTEELGNEQVDGNTPDSPSTGSNETSGSSTDTPPADPNAPAAPTEPEATGETTPTDGTPTETQPEAPAPTI